MDTDLLEVSNSHNTAAIFFFTCLVIMVDFEKVSFHSFYGATLLEECGLKNHSML